MPPAPLSFCPAPLPAIVSVWPTCVSAPSDLNACTPELIVMIGMCAFLARRSASLSALGFGADATIPAGLRATAVLISWACFCGLLKLSV